MKLHLKALVGPRCRSFPAGFSVSKPIASDIFKAYLEDGSIRDAEQGLKFGIRVSIPIINSSPQSNFAALEWWFGKLSLERIPASVRGQLQCPMSALLQLRNSSMTVCLRIQRKGQT